MAATGRSASSSWVGGGISGAHRALLLFVVSWLLAACNDSEPKTSSTNAPVTVTPPACTADAQCGGGICSAGECLVCENVDFDFDRSADPIPSGANVSRAYRPGLSISARANGHSVEPIARDIEKHDHSPGSSKHDNVLVARKEHAHHTTFEFQLETPACVASIDLVDIERRERATVTLYDASGASLGEFQGKAGGNHAEQELALGNTCGVSRVVVTINGSGALDDLRLCAKKAPLDRCSRVAPDGAADSFDPVTGARGLLTIQTLTDAPDPFSPDRNGVSDTTTLSATASVAPPGRFGAEIPFEYEIIDGATCVPVRTLVGEARVAPDGTARLEATWDGRDRHGDVAPDGIYFYRLSAELEKKLRRDGHDSHDHGHGHGHFGRGPGHDGDHDHDGAHGRDHDRDHGHGVVRELDSVLTPFQHVTLDTTPLRIVLEEPRPAGGQLTVQWDPRVSGTTLAVSGTVEPIRDLRQLDIFLNGGALSVTVAPNGRFTASGTLNVSGPGPIVENFLSVVATDAFGVQTAVEVVIPVRIDAVVRGTATVRFNPEATETDIRAAVASVGGTLRHRNRAVREAVITFDTSADPRSVVASLGAHPAVGYASTTGARSDDGLCDGNPATTDPQRNTPGQYYLHNTGTYVAFEGGHYCRVGMNDCANPQDECVTGICIQGSGGVNQNNGSTTNPCATNADCAAVSPTATCSTSNRCLAFGFVGSMSCANDAECQTATGDPSATCVATGQCGKTSSAGADFGWEDASATICSIQASGPEVLVNFAEWGGGVNISHRDLETRVWTNFVECGGTPCLVNADCVAALGAGSSCIQATMCDGPDADRLPDCVQGTPSPADGCPGACGDDDDDGYADGADPEVQALTERLNQNCLDDDGDGTVDDGRPALAAEGTAESGGSCGNCFDDDSDGVADDGCPARAALGPAESTLALEDDDEDGYIDDIHGFLFAEAFGSGERAGSTHPAVIQLGWHATLVASSAASQLDNAQELAGINPRVRLMTTSTGGKTYFVEAMRYAASKGARVTSMSWGDESCDCSAPCTGTARTNYEQCVVANERRFLDGLSPDMLYVNSAGNFRYDLTTLAIPDATDSCSGTGGWCMARFPQTVGVYLDVNGNRTVGGTGTPFNIVIAAIDMRDRLLDYYIGWSDSGSNIGTLVSGGTAVDLGSLTDNVDKLDSTLTSGIERTNGMTSFATPAAAGVASTVIAAFPNIFDRRPAKLFERLRDTRAPCQAPGAGLRGCAGNMLSPGRVNLFNALDATTFPLPGFTPWEDESFRLNDNTMSLTHDVDFVDSDADGDVDFILEIFGGPTLEQQQLKIHWYDPVTQTFQDESVARLTSDFTGNYNKADVGDVNGDGCKDFALAGFLQPATAPDAFQGLTNRLALQNVSGGTCLGTFRDATNELVGGVARLPTRNDITRDVDLFDLEPDGDLDILFTNATFPAPGGAFGDQLLRNDGTGAFTDVTGQLDDTVTGDAHKASAACFVNADAFVDIVQAVNGGNRILINDGTGNFTNEGLARGLPADTGFSHDIECHDFYNADGSVGQDGRPELVFARRSGLADLLYLNDGSGNFSDVSARLGGFTDTTQEVEICDLDGMGAPEILVGNGDIVTFLSQPDRALRMDGSGNFTDATAALGFHFASVFDLTEDIECADLDGVGGIDAVLVGNTGQRNWLYRRH